MTRLITIRMIISFSLIGCSSLQPGKPVLRPDSYGLVVFGSQLMEVEKTLDEKAQPQDHDPECDYVRFTSYPGMRFMVEHGIITRGDALDNDIPNELKINVGTSYLEVSRLYPLIIIQPHHYDPGGHYLILKSDDGRHAIVLEESGGKITLIRGGVEPSVEYVEGCL